MQVPFNLRSCFLHMLLAMGLLVGHATADEPRAVVVNVLTYSSTTGNGKGVGRCKPVTVTADGSGGSTARVGFFESEVGGTGDQWRSSGWMAAVTAAMLTDFDPRATRVSFEYEGRIDGPSAGALLTCGVLAAVRGDSIRTDAAMTGTINPDGSIGPVAGIAHKIGGAANKGMKLVLIPAGIRFDTADDGKRVDVVEYGDSLGVRVVNVFDVYHAYRLLTGVELPRDPAAHMPQVSLAAQKATRKKISVWYDRYEQSLKSFLELKNTAALSQEVIDMYQQGVDAIKRSNELVEEGEFTPALWDRIFAAACGYLALETGRCRYTYATRGYDGLVERLKNNQWLEAEVEKVSARMKTETPRSLDQLSVYLIACDAFVEGVALQRLAQVSLTKVPAEESEEAIAQIAVAAENQIIGWLDLKLAADYLDLMAGYAASAAIPDDAPWRQAGDYLRKASSANSAVFEAIVIQPTAQELSLAGSDMRSRLMNHDRTYAILRGAEQYVFPNLERYFGDGDALGYAYLATSLYTHIRAAGLLAKYYSLDADLNDAGFIVGLERERTLAEWLTFSEDQSRRSIAALQDNGVDASVCAQMYAIARIKARRDLTQQFEGLIGFWSADMHARVIRLVSGLSQGKPAAALESADTATLPE